MARTLHFLVWIAVMTASAYECKHTAYTSSDSDSSLHYDYPSQEPIGILDNRAYDRMNTRSANISPASYSAHIPDDVKITQLRLGEQTATRTENESKVLSWKPYAESRRGQNTDKIVFPGPTAKEIQLEIPEHCKSLGSCKDVPNYPPEQAQKAILELSNLGTFQDDKLDLPDVPDITQRVGREEDNIELCKFEEKYVYPEAVIDSSGKWDIVLKQDDNQGLKVEICKNVSKNEGQSSELKIREEEWKDLSSCARFVEFLDGYQGRCKQKFVSRNVTVRLEDGTNLVRPLKVPSCCSCVARAIRS